MVNSNNTAISLHGQIGDSDFATELFSEGKKNIVIKPIIDLLDEAPIITETMFVFWEWIADYYLCNLGEVMQAALPAGLKLQSNTLWTLNPEFEAENKLSKSEMAVLYAMPKNASKTSDELSKLSGIKNVLPQIKKLLEKGALELEVSLSDNYKPKMASFVSVAAEYSTENAMHALIDSLKNAPKQQAILMAVLQFGLNNFDTPTNSPNALPKFEISTKDLLSFSGISSAPLAELVKKGILLKSFKRVERTDTVETEIVGINPLNDFQQEAYRKILESFEKHATVLLHGITSSGKTELYIHLIEAQLQQGKQVLYLLPEIALTEQIINRLKKAFGKQVGVYHSKFSDSERVEIWNRSTQSKTGELTKHTNVEEFADYKLILGTRSAVFIPFNKLGLIIIDEEHETTYKQQEPAPRYHARDAAIYLAHLNNAKVLLGSATPAYESYMNANIGKYGLVELTQRHGNMQMPTVEILNTVKLRKQNRMKTHFSDPLLIKIKQCLTNKEQVILFQNRRGYSPFIECSDCAHVPVCEYCDVSLTYHKYKNILSCHYCGYSIESLKKCPACSSTALETKGFGTEKIEDEISIMFPEANLARMDSDTTGNRNAYRKLISDFEQGKTDILIGTQMISKGLDFDNVSTVGVLNADNMLNMPDFRAFERSYQQIMQVSGRAGRKNKQGVVLIQTGTPDHAVIQNIVKGSYQNLFVQEMEHRKMFKYPPFFKLILFNVKHFDKPLTDRAAESFAVLLRSRFGNRVLGPEYPAILKIRNKFQKNILLKIERTAPLSKGREIILQALEEFKASGAFNNVQIIINVDPY